VIQFLQAIKKKKVIDENKNLKKIKSAKKLTVFNFVWITRHVEVFLIC